MVLAGDSIMASLTPALRAALREAGAQPDYELYIALPGSPDVVAPSAAGLTEGADLVVLLIGLWEDTALRNGDKPGVDFPVAGWEQAYRSLYVRPWLDAATRAGTPVIWIGMTGVDDPAVAREIAVLDDVYRTEVERVPAARFVDAGPLLTGPGGRYRPVVTGADGVEQRLLAHDGTHLCPAGAAIVADAVLAQLPDELGLTPDPDWRERTDWATHDRVVGRPWYTPALCG